MIPTQPNARLGHRLIVAAIVAMLAAGAISTALPAQQPPARTDTVPLRADFRDLNELLQKLPNVAPPDFDESRALWLEALPMACLDRLQSRPGGRGGARGGAAAADTSGARGAGNDSAGRGGGRRGGGMAGTPSASSDSSGRGAGGRAAGGAGNSGAGYFWVPTYSLVADHDRLRAFWGCNDWHSAVASTWVTVRLLRTLPNGPLRELTREKLNAHLGKSNLEGELAFFHAAAAAINPIPSASQQGGLFERPYGFAWLLKLQSELHTWPDSQARRWAGNVAPLAAWMADSLGAYIAKLVEPVRSGAQTNTALSMTLALDYADVVGDTKLKAAMVSTARRFYLTDKACATQNERVVSAAGGRGGRGGGGGGGRGGRGAGRGANADSAARAAGLPNDLTAAGRGAAPPGAGGGGQEILSPCLTEAALMSRVLEPRAFVAWLDAFLPPLQSGLFAPLTEAVNIPVAAPPTANAATAARGAAPDTSPAALAAAAAAAAAALGVERARLSALSFERAQAMERIAHALPPTDTRVAAWHRLSAIQADRGFELMRDDQAGIYWLPAQALLYVTVRK
jgi:hypothetical protein